MLTTTSAPSISPEHTSSVTAVELTEHYGQSDTVTKADPIYRPIYDAAPVVSEAGGAGTEPVYRPIYLTDPLELAQPVKVAVAKELDIKHHSDM